MRKVCVLFVVVMGLAVLGSAAVAGEPSGALGGTDPGLSLGTGDFKLSLGTLQEATPPRERAARGSRVQLLPTAISPALNNVSALIPMVLGAEEAGDDVPGDDVPGDDVPDDAPAEEPADEPAEAAKDDDYSTYLSLKLGPQWFLGDADDLDPGIYSEIALGYEVLPILALELASGFFWGEGDSGGVDAEIWGVPILAQAKVTLPIWILHLYGGLGVGGYYIDSDVDIGALSDDESDWVFGGNVFLGALMSFERLYLGLEGKYTITDDADVAFDESVNLEGLALMAVLGFRF